MLPKENSQENKELVVSPKSELTVEHCRTQEGETFDRSNPPFEESKQTQSELERDSLRTPTRTVIGNIFLLISYCPLSTTFFTYL